jgi:hypothetical protein
MKNAIRFGFVTLVLTGILAASVAPQNAMQSFADGTSPVPLCRPGDPSCKPPIQN